MKLVAAYITLNENNIFFKASLEAILPHIDGVVVIDGGSKDGTVEMLDSLNDSRIHVIHVPYRSNLRESNGMQRNEYLKWVGRIYGYDDVFVQVLDADEIVSDDYFLVRDILKGGKFNVYNQQMCHFIQDLGHVDSTLNGGPNVDPKWKHFVHRRLFKLTPALFYPEVEHPLLMGFEGEIGELEKPTVYHLGYAKGIMDIIKKGINHRKKSNIHSPQFLDWWVRSHLWGVYPRREIGVDEINSGIIREWLK